MDIDTSKENAFLYELYTQTNGDVDKQVSMYDIGTALGLEESDTGAMAENLFIQGLAEMKTLSGGIGITHQGMKAIDITPPVKPGDEQLSLGNGLVVEETSKNTVEKIIQDIKTHIAETKQSYEQLEEIVIDIKTMEIQMVSPQPKTQIIREILRSIHSNLNGPNLNKLGPEDLVDKLNMLISS